MPKFLVELGGLAYVTASVEVYAKNVEEAKEKASDPDTVFELDWEYEELREITGVYCSSRSKSEPLKQGYQPKASAREGKPIPPGDE